MLQQHIQQRKKERNGRIWLPLATRCEDLVQWLTLATTGRDPPRGLWRPLPQHRVKRGQPLLLLIFKLVVQLVFKLVVQLVFKLVVQLVF